MKKWIVAYFSPTGGTKKVADAIAAGWSSPVVEIDLTKADSSALLGENDALMVVLPVFKHTSTPHHVVVYFAFCVAKFGKPRFLVKVSIKTPTAGDTDCINLRLCFWRRRCNLAVGTAERDSPTACKTCHRHIGFPVDTGSAFRIPPSEYRAKKK